MGVSTGQPNISQLSVSEIAQLTAGIAATQPNSETVSKCRQRATGIRDHSAHGSLRNL
jgi:hypothetical protein